MKKPIGFYDYTVIATYLGFGAAGMGCFYTAEGKPREALICLMLAGAFDMVDGKIASTKKDRTVPEKRFGIQIDSLCDLVSFGVLPALFLNCFPLSGAVRRTVGILFVLAALIRLAYFNVTEELRQDQTDGKREYYEGLPVTSVALFLPFLYLSAALLGIPEAGGAAMYPAALALTGILFLSPFRLKKAGGRMMAIMGTFGAVLFAGLFFVR